ncbi:MAG: hypothetical protein A2509_02995 [Candidatus Edwardsbacteria bacterium RIFOXYD12_FULL_50_11]|uniref:Uncharacterized protein n=1 Tax=Candidatus Edwardsbacteria bacterium GWF2_54_11 TaxID=1817851 RepID=A0A1F5RJ30_9BACT|nr:MAG: hypothetical protein A2502_06860 [Candidatus Edwardsbacteria bacterium RifOxyC12_full_54_24]OGF06984.1 MAG: hypothetical protein A2273_08570 [Candidatus Edwardsbacteria bacterium RifOxyA12_full_54_48]OGF11050.1 MAG: hypothetical protein A3K15_07940 [Candidatus Edwardsbacteria bacterium GWE2_54_12]OGF14051.1 MAG: hypothetical protein A2024_05825 [Candidatus Edwardsbacteria bacterium GWF2_54_11]OGF15996.1 MAG: hypothetical protein A2509_02995 [Candidatus Edwardsbacteria bacterium RIFOXYD1
MTAGKKQTPQGKIMVIMPDGKVMEPSIILTIEDLRDKEKTVMKMFGGSPQMTMSAKEALMVDISEVVANLVGDRIELAGQYKTDTLVYYAPTAFSGDKERAITVANKVYAQRLMKLEKERRDHTVAIARLKDLYESERNKIGLLTAKILEVKNSGVSEEKNQQQVSQAREEAMKMAEETILAIENEKKDLEQTVDQLEALLHDSISIAQHSEEMERLKTEYDEVNRRAMRYRPSENLSQLSREQKQELAKLLPKLKGTDGNDRYFDLRQVLKIKDRQSGLLEGTHVLVKYRPADETKYFMGRLFFNDTKDYICLGQGFEITSGVYTGRDRKETPTDESVLQYLNMNPLSVQIYLEAVRNSAIQTVQFWLHDLRAEQLMEIQSIDPLIVQLMKDSMKIAHERAYEVNATCDEPQPSDPRTEEDRGMVDPVLAAVKKAVAQPLAMKYVLDEQDLKKRINQASDQMQKEALARQLKRLQGKKHGEIRALYESLKKMLMDEEMVGPDRINFKKYVPILELRKKISESMAERIKRDDKLPDSILD